MTIIDVFLGVLLALMVRSAMSKPGKCGARDATDNPRGGRSGLVLYTDHETGVQYVGTALGGLTVRVDAQGRPMLAEGRR